MKCVLDNVSHAWWTENAESILKMLMQIEDPKSTELLLQRFQIGASCPVDLLMTAISQGKQDFVSCLLSSGLELPEKRIEDVMSLALQTKNLSLIKELCTHAEKQKISCATYPEILGLNLKTVDLEKTLFGYALHSPLGEIYALAKKHPQFKPVLQSVLRKISLVVRFPSLEQASQVKNTFSDREVYIRDSNAYAEENLCFLNELLEESTTPDRSTLLDKIILNRYKRMPKKNKEYITKQVDKPKQMNTSLMEFDSELEDAAGNRHVHFTPTQYHWSLRHFATLCYNDKENQWELPDGYQGEWAQWNYNYNIPKTDKSLIINGYYQGKWLHPTGPTIAELQEHIDQLHDLIMNYKLDLNDTENKRLYYKMEARCYYLQAVLCETHRGTPHNVMMWLKYVRAYHKLHPPIPKREHFFLDNTMLMLPVDKVIELWETFFEPPPPKELFDEITGSEQEKGKIQKSLDSPILSDRND